MALPASPPYWACVLIPYAHCHLWPCYAQLISVWGSWNQGFLLLGHCSKSRGGICDSCLLGGHHKRKRSWQVLLLWQVSPENSVAYSPCTHGAGQMSKGRDQGGSCLDTLMPQGFLLLKSACSRSTHEGLKLAFNDCGPDVMGFLTFPWVEMQSRDPSLIAKKTGKCLPSCAWRRSCLT